jgi:hypothetical protein
MNERIKQLATEARLLTGWPVGEVEYQRFAELIVRECANAIVNDSRLSDVRTARNGCVRTIKEHFGVEE